MSLGSEASENRGGVGLGWAERWTNATQTDIDTDKQTHKVRKVHAQTHRAMLGFAPFLSQAPSLMQRAHHARTLVAASPDGVSVPPVAAKG